MTDMILEIGLFVEPLSLVVLFCPIHGLPRFLDS